MKIPNLFIVGAPKAGTTSLYDYLNQHPEIYMSPVKEPNFFITVPENRHVVCYKDIEEYLKLFSKATNEKVLGEASTNYLLFPGAEKKIKSFNPDSKIIIMLRNPVERAISHYFMFKDRFMVENDPPEIAMKNLNDARINWFHGLGKNPYIFSSLYFEHVQRYISVFGDKQVKIIIFEKFVRTISDSIKEIFQFLNVDASFKLKNLSKKNYYEKPKYEKLVMLSNKNFSVYLRKLFPQNIRHWIRNHILFSTAEKPVVSEKVKIYLYENYFKDDILKLSDLLQIDLNEIWKFHSNK